MDSPELVLEASSVVEGGAQDASLKACAALEDDIPIGEFPYVDEAYVKASLVEETGASLPWARWASLAVDGARRPLDRLVLSSYMKPLEWARPTAGF